MKLENLSILKYCFQWKNFICSQKFESIIPVWNERVVDIKAIGLSTKLFNKNKTKKYIKPHDKMRI